MEQNELKEVLRLHGLWLKNEPEGKKANLSYADLSYADLRGANLSYADLRGASLRNADLSDANLSIRAYQISRIGSSNRMTTYLPDENEGKGKIFCGCFTGTFDEWVEKIRETYPDKDSKFRKQYELAIQYFTGLKAL